MKTVENPPPSHLAKQRIAIIGSGAIGGHFAARLQRAGHRVCMLARGATLAALQTHGLRYQSADGAFTVPVLASADPARLGVQDLVVIALKGQAVAMVAPTLAPLLHAQTVVLTVGNGLPWWYFLDQGIPCAGLSLRSVDPQGLVERALPFAQVLGGSIFASCYCPEPGSVVHSAGGRVVLGEPRGGQSERAQYWANTLSAAMIPTLASDNVRLELWLKLLGNACFNPVSFLTLATTDKLTADPHLERMFIRLMDECIAVGMALGLPLTIDPRQRINQARQLGAIKTSMLQDLEGGRSIEIDAILGCMLECAEATRVPTAQLESLYAMVRMRAVQGGLYEPGPNALATAQTELQV